MLQEMQEIVEYLREHYCACVELCGKDDEVNTLPAKKIYKKALQVYTDIQMKVKDI